MLAEFHWLRPWWLLAIPMVIGLAIALRRGTLGDGNWGAVIDAALLPYVLSRRPTEGADKRWWLLGLAGVLAATALAGPAWQRMEQPVFRTEQALVIALDLSRSMDAQDIAPSRLTRAKLKILDMLERRKSGQTALVVYSANAFTVAPLTTDTDTVASLVNSLSTDIMPSRGSYPEVAIEKGRLLLDQAGVSFGEVLLITDGGSSAAAIEKAKQLEEVGYSLSILGVGTSEGAPIPRLSGGFVTDSRGKIAVPRLESSGLEDLAERGGGRYAELSADDRDLNVLLSGEIAGSGRAASDESLATDRWHEEGPWLVLLLLPLAALAFRRGWVLLAFIVIAPLPQIAEAATFADLWKNKDQQAADALADGRANDAAVLFDDPHWKAVAAYRAGEFSASAEQFSAQGDVRNRYNLGNALAMDGDLEGAIEAYQAVLTEQPDHEDAAYNLDLVEQLKQQQDAQQQSEGDDQQSTENPGGDGEESESDSDADQQGSEGQSEADQPSDQSDSSNRGDEEMSEEDMQALQEALQKAAEEAESNEEPQQLSEAELAELRQVQEQQQAMEQWLRRVPDDPGGLLRRKFRYQYQRSGKDQEGNDVWPDNEVQPW